MNRFAALGIASGLAVSGCSVPARLAVPDPPRAIEFEALIEDSPLGVAENIRVTPLQRSEAMSAHLVRIRDREQPHVHTRCDLAVLVLHGIGTLWLNNQPVAMRPGDAAIVPKGTPHYFVNESADPAAALVIFAPPFDEPDQAPAVPSRETGDGRRE